MKKSKSSTFYRIAVIFKTPTVNSTIYTSFVWNVRWKSCIAYTKQNMQVLLSEANGNNKQDVPAVGECSKQPIKCLASFQNINFAAGRRMEWTLRCIASKFYLGYVILLGDTPAHYASQPRLGMGPRSPTATSMYRMHFIRESAIIGIRLMFS